MVLITGFVAFNMVIKYDVLKTLRGNTLGDEAQPKHGSTIRKYIPVAAKTEI